MSKKFKVTISESGEQFNCKDGQIVLEAMVQLGRRGIPSGCHGGGCGVCKVRVADGDFSTQKMSRAHVSEAEEKDGCALACRLFANSDISLQVLGGMKKNLV